ncbi:MAG: 30S ribosome-binding factor RbfA [Alphaproteobacteria bacterium]|nr:30S ribosome-binding factor RbfA [Alphaproteobacteria bacterium]
MSRSKGRSPSQRQLRVGEELRHVLADILAHGDLRDPALKGLSITVSEVRASADMRQATAFVMPLGGAGDPAEVVVALNRAAAFLGHEVGRRITMKFTPVLRFEMDSAFDEAQRIESLLRRPAVARDLKRDGPDDGA